MGTETLPSSNTIEEILDVGSSDLEILDAPDGEDEEVTFDSLYAYLLANEDIIITIDAESEEAVRRGLSVVKLNHTKKMKAAGERIEDKVLKFNVVERVTRTLPGESDQIRLQIWLAKKSGVKVHRMVVSEKGL